MPVRPIEIMEKHTYDADKDGRIEKDAIEITLNKLLKGAGGADPTEIDGDNAFYGLLSQGLASARPAAGVIGCLYYSTDTKVLERDNGTTWDEVARGETVTRLAQLSEKAHSSLTGIGASDHHVKTAAASEITSGRFVLARLPDGTAGYFLKAGGAGVDSAFAALATADIASGRLALARLPDGTSGYFLKAGGAGIDPAYALLAAGDIPSLDAAKITTGRFGVARMPDGTSGQVLTAQGVGVDPAYAAAGGAFRNHGRAWVAHGDNVITLPIAHVDTNYHAICTLYLPTMGGITTRGASHTNPMTITVRPETTTRLKVRLHGGYGFTSCGYDNVGIVGTTQRFDDVANTHTARANATARAYLAGYSLNGYGFTSCGYTTASVGTTQRFDDVANTHTARTSATARISLTGYSLNEYFIDYITVDE